MLAEPLLWNGKLLGREVADGHLVRIYSSFDGASIYRAMTEAPATDPPWPCSPLALSLEVFLVLLRHQAGLLNARQDGAPHNCRPSTPVRCWPMHTPPVERGIAPILKIYARYRDRSRQTPNWSLCRAGRCATQLHLESLPAPPQAFRIFCTSCPRLQFVQPAPLPVSPQPVSGKRIGDRICRIHSVTLVMRRPSINPILDRQLQGLALGQPPSRPFFWITPHKR